MIGTGRFQPQNRSVRGDASPLSIDRLNAIEVTTEDFNAAMDAIVMNPGEDLHATILSLHPNDSDRGHAVFRRLDALIHAASSMHAPGWISPVPTSRSVRVAMLEVAARIRLVVEGDAIRFAERELFAEIQKLRGEEEAGS